MFPPPDHPEAGASGSTLAPPTKNEEMSIMKESVSGMSQEIIRCPYCVLGGEFRPMFRKTKKCFVCISCGHTARPEEPYSKCACSRCLELARLASRRRIPDDPRKHPAADVVSSR